MAKFVNLIAGSALVGTGLFLEFVTLGASTPLTMFLISAGIGMVITGIGTLLQKGPLLGTSTTTRNPIAPWNVIYGRAKVGGTLVYFGSFGDSDKYLDLIIVLACHACKSVDALLFDGQRIQIDPASGSSFTPLEQTVSIFHISRSDDVVTVVLNANIPLLQAGDDVIIQNVTGDKTLNGRYPVLQVISQVVGGPGSITFSYVCGGAPAIVDLEGQVLTTWPDYRAKVHVEVLLGNHTATFPGMINGTPYDGDVGNLVLNPGNPWGADHKLLGKTAVFLRLHYNDEVFGNGLPAISFHVSGKADIVDPRGIPATGPTDAPGVGVDGIQGTSHYSYVVVARAIGGGQIGAASPPGSTAIGNNILSRHNFNAVVWPLVSGAVSYDLYRTVGWITGKIATTPNIWFNDTGFVGDGTTPPAGSTLQTGSSGYTENAALCIADFLAHQTWGFKAVYGSEIPSAQLIAAANLCDEPVPLAIGGTEPRYALNGGFPLTMKRGEVLQNLLTSCGGRLTYSGGQFVIHPAGWPGVSFALPAGASESSPAGWTPRVSAHNANGIDTFDAIAAAAATYSGTATWPGACNIINWAALVALKSAGGTPAYVQGIGNASAFVGGAFHTWTAPAFPSPNAAGNCLVVDVAFSTGYPLSGATVTDSQGNIYKPVFGFHTPGSASFVICFVAPDCAGGPNTVTITQSGGFDFQAIAVALHEYSGLSAILPVTTPPVNYGLWGPDLTGVCEAAVGSSGPAANTQTECVTTSAPNDVLHFIVASLPYCGGVTVSGGPPLPPGFLTVAAGPFRWRSKVSVRDLYNGVKGTYLCPGNKWQPSDIPPYAQDSLHGYASGSPLYPEGDANMAADGGVRRWLDIQAPFTISTSAAQRLAKIELMRRRQQGVGTFVFNMALYQTTALDVIQMSLPLLGWTDKLLEISAHRFKLDKVQTGGGGEVTLLGTEIDVQETDPSVYEWDPSEELSARGYQQAILPSNITLIPNTHQESLTDGAGNLIFANGDTITVLGVPN